MNSSEMPFLSRQSRFRRALRRGNPVSHVDERAGGVEPTTKGFGSETALVRQTHSSSRIIRLTSHNTLLSANEIIPQLDKPTIAFARYRAARQVPSGMTAQTRNCICLCSLIRTLVSIMQPVVSSRSVLA